MQPTWRHILVTEKLCRASHLSRNAGVEFGGARRYVSATKF
jgi:hypothetical protein